MVQCRQKEYKVRKITPSMAVIDITTDFTIENLMALSNKLAKDHMFSSSTIRMDLRLYTELIQKEDFDERIMYPSARFSGRLMEYNGCKIMEPGKDNVITLFNTDSCDEIIMPERISGANAITSSNIWTDYETIMNVDYGARVSAGRDNAYPVNGDLGPTTRFDAEGRQIGGPEETISRVQVYDTVLGTWTTVRQNGGIID